MSQVEQGRSRLKNCRPTVTETVLFHGLQFHISAGRFDDGRPAEAFVSGPKSGSHYAALANDAAILLSLAFQFGVPLPTIAHALSRDASNDPASIIGLIADRIGEMCAERCSDSPGTDVAP